MSAAASSSSPIEPATLREALGRGLDFLASQQGADGSWRGDYGGPLFLLPMYVAAHYIAGREIPSVQRAAMIRYLLGVQNADGSISLHADADAGTMFTSTLTYVALRILGVEADDPRIASLRQWIRSHGTPLGAAPWGKWVLALLNLYDYRGVTPVLPELYLLPFAVPLHPARFWCHTRQVYLPTAYLYGTKARIEENDLVRQLRGELYDRPYHQIDFAQYQRHTAASDRLAPKSRWATLAGWIADKLERIHLPGLRRRALDRLLEHIEYEDRTTGYHRIGPVNAVFNTLVHVFRGAPADVLEASWRGLERYLHDGPDGIKMNGYLSTSLWDTAFAVQAMLAAPFADAYRSTLQRAAAYVKAQQIRSELTDAARFYRDPVLGGWPFCDVVHGWPITDCTAEGLKATLGLATALGSPSDKEDLDSATEFLLRYQNREGGWSTYERRRGGYWLERLNPSQMFCDIMVDYPFVECTSACVQALAAVSSRGSGSRELQIRAAIDRGARFLRRRQRADGSWEGAWGICFTYGTWFGVRGLRAAGMPPSAEPIRRAVQFLLGHQQSNGGWGEHYLSCLEGRYVARSPSLVVNTAWALLTLVDGGVARAPAAMRAAEYLATSQQSDGDWPREAMTGIFNRTTAINYENYRRYFPIWALAEYLRAIS